jgi:hypothetical protein
VARIRDSSNPDSNLIANFAGEQRDSNPKPRQGKKKELLEMMGELSIGYKGVKMRQSGLACALTESRVLEQIS